MNVHNVRKIELQIIKLSLISFQNFKFKKINKSFLPSNLEHLQTNDQIAKTIETNSSLQVISKETVEQSMVQRSDDCTDTINTKCLKYETTNLNEDNFMKANADQQVIAQYQNNLDINNLNNQLNNQIKNQINQINSTLNDLDKNALNGNLSINQTINSNIQTNLTSELNSNININLNINTNLNATNANLTTASNANANKNDFVIISVLKKQGVPRAKCQNDVATKKYVKFEDGYRPGDENIIEQQRTTLLPSLMANTLNANLNANLMANLAAQTNLTATSQIPSRISFKPFLAHSQLTYAQKGLLLNNNVSSSGHHSTTKTRTSKRHLSSSHHRHQLAQQKLMQLSTAAANGGSLRNTATYTVLNQVLSKSSATKLNQTSNNKHLINNSNRSSNSNRKFVYHINGKLLVNSYSNYNDFYIKNNDMFHNEKMLSYVLLA